MWKVKNFCEENKINYTTEDFETFSIECFFCSKFFTKKLKWLLRNSSPKCDRCSQKCEHDKQRRRCKECKGSSICEHDKRRSRCKDCKDQGSGGSSLCKTPLCSTFANRKYNGYCIRCFIFQFPDIPVTRNYKTKEKEVVDRILSYTADRWPKQLDWVHDKRIQDGCSKRRPDLLLDLGSHVLIIEIDEQSHSDYNCSCEAIRLQDISVDIGLRPIIIIRFNPDSYVRSSDGKKIPSCWDTNKLGIYTITHKKNWETRIRKLLDQIDFWMLNVPEGVFEIDEDKKLRIEIVELFF